MVVSIFQSLIAESPVMKEKLDIAARIAQTDSPVFLLGEAGVGKELFARYIYSKSKRSEQKFVHINCLKEDTDFLDLFHGTLTVFFDEISCLTLLRQQALLDAFKKKSGDIRIISSTKHDIEQMIAEGAFLRELYYKLNVIPIFIPPLRDRKEDILTLASYFLKNFAFEIKKDIGDFDGEAQEALIAHPWNGNVRELRNMVERASLNSDAPLIYKKDLFVYNESAYYSKIGEGGYDLKRAVNAFKAFFLEKVLETARGNQTAAAKMLGIQRTYLSKLIKDLQIRSCSKT